MLILMADRFLDDQDIQKFGDELKHAAKAKQLHLLLNFSKVEYLSSAALGKLVVLRKQVETVKGKLALSNIDSSIYEAFKITGFDRIFKIFEDEQEAIKYLQQ